MMVSFPNSLINAVSVLGAPIVPLENECPICAFPNAFTFPAFGFAADAFVAGTAPVETPEAETDLLFTASICAARFCTLLFRLSTAVPAELNCVIKPPRFSVFKASISVWSVFTFPSVVSAASPILSMPSAALVSSACKAIFFAWSSEIRLPSASANLNCPLMFSRNVLISSAAIPSDSCSESIRPDTLMLFPLISIISSSFSLSMTAWIDSASSTPKSSICMLSMPLISCMIW